MTYVPNYTVLPAQKIPLYCLETDGKPDPKKIKPAIKEAFKNSQILWVNEHFLPFWDCKAKFQVYKGGSGSGKSRYVALKLLTKCLTNEYFRCLYCRKKFITIRKSCFQLFKDIINENGWKDLFIIKESDYEIICIHNENKFLPAGLDDVENLKSIEGITDVWIEEAITNEEKVTDTDFRELIRRVRTNKAELFFYITFNPVDTDNFIYRVFVQGKKYPYYDPDNFRKNSFILDTSTYQHNFFLEETYIEEYDLLKGEDYNEWLVYACGEWGNPRTGKEYLHKFKLETHKGFIIYNPKLETIISVDFNVEPFITATVINTDIQQGRKKINIVDCICLEHPLNDIDELVEELRKRGYLGKNKRVRWVCDATGKNKIPGFGDKKEVIPYHRLKKMMLMYCSPQSDKTSTMRKNPSKLIAKIALNKIFSNKLAFKKVGQSNIDVVINQDLIKVIDECRYLQSDKDGFDNERTTVKGKTVEKRGHIMSTLIYGFHYICPNYFEKKENLF